MICEKLAKNIKFYREKNKFSQLDLSKRIGITQQAVSLWETGKKSPKLKDLESIASALDVNVEHLLGLEIRARESFSVPAIESN